MALKSTVFKADLQVSDLERNHYGQYVLTIARHPSETDERMMMRVLGFALFASERLMFCKGLSSTEEPDLWELDLTGAIKLWIDVGLPDARRLQKACGRADRVVVLAYGTNVDSWWSGVLKAYPNLKNLTVLRVISDESRALVQLVSRGMSLQCTIQEDLVWLGNANSSIELKPVILQGTRT